MAKLVDLTPEALDEAKSRITNQLWRYYSVEFDVESIREISPGEYELTGSNDDYARCHNLIKCKLYESGVVEDLYYWDGADYIKPTTTAEQQEER